jgi:hypothetical protein
MFIGFWHIFGTYHVAQNKEQDNIGLTFEQDL